MTHFIATGFLSAVITLAAAGALPNATLDQPGRTGRTESNSTTASCLLKISWDESILPLDGETLDTLMRSSAVFGQVTRDVLGLPRDLDTEQNVGVSLKPAGNGDSAGTMLLDLGVGFRDASIRPVAEEFMAALCDRLRSTLEQLAVDQRRHFEEGAALAERELREAREALEVVHMIQRKLCEEADRSDLRREHLLEQIGDLENQRRESEMEHVAQAARRRAIEMQIARVSDQIAKHSETDTAVAELRKVLELKIIQMANIDKLVEAAAASEREVLGARERVAEARIALAQHQQSVADRSGGGMLADFNMELARMAIDSAESEARREFIAAELAKMKSILPLADRFEQEVQMALPLAREMMEEATRRHSELTRRLRAIRRPTVLVIGADAGRSGERKE